MTTLGQYTVAANYKYSAQLTGTIADGMDHTFSRQALLHKCAGKSGAASVHSIWAEQRHCNLAIIAQLLINLVQRQPFWAINCSSHACAERQCPSRHRCDPCAMRCGPSSQAP